MLDSVEYYCGQQQPGHAGGAEQSDYREALPPDAKRPGGDRARSDVGHFQRHQARDELGYSLFGGESTAQSVRGAAELDRQPDADGGTGSDLQCAEEG